jgi:hypothetical protein
VRHTPAVALYGHLFLKARQGDRSVELRQRAVRAPPNQSACDDHNNSEDPKYDPNNGSQTDPLVMTNLSLEEAWKSRNRSRSSCQRSLVT